MHLGYSKDKVFMQGINKVLQNVLFNFNFSNFNDVSFLEFYSQQVTLWVDYFSESLEDFSQN